jgi:hypothetical protein
VAGFLAGTETLGQVVSFESAELSYQLSWFVRASNLAKKKKGEFLRDLQAKAEYEQADADERQNCDYDNEDYNCNYSYYESH